MFCSNCQHFFCNFFYFFVSAHNSSALPLIFISPTAIYAILTKYHTGKYPNNGKPCLNSLWEGQITPAFHLYPKVESLFQMQGTTSPLFQNSNLYSKTTQQSERCVVNIDVFSSLTELFFQLFALKRLFFIYQAVHDKRHSYGSKAIHC